MLASSRPGKKGTEGGEDGDVSAAVREMQKMKVYSFKEGVETLARALEQKIRDDENTDVLLGAGVQRIDQVRSLLSKKSYFY
jgi:protoporphyrinogen oxidase